ncbi:Ppx/GppA family phosphatase [Waterburya agarophytonicola K14]|uniref:Ppx/GppA family phosphatase n=1 Tax=Waterburya agarophytonicola KI4 TaxID=2874699 RepID=A0A964BRF5_9CYAN|nr:Ppx/GppA phosphatase family protein [Waterburya agarophytonicola]MCC0177188.1 Ppx/GppA family phosphatase [Waterburya agarophytonicola KI4]
MNKQIIAAIDIGTNSIHMVIVQIEPTLPAFTVIAKEKDTVRLGDRDPETGQLTSEAIKRSLDTLRRCRDLAISLGAKRIIAVATSATREAPNGEAFLRQIEAELGIVVNLISGQEEARRIYLGVLSGMDFNDSPHIIIDIGGGSTELILADIHEARFLSSTKIGAVRLAKEFVTTDPISDKELKILQAYVRGMLERPVDEIWRNLQLNEVPQIIGTSGTIETIAAIHAKDELGEVPDPLNGYEISRKDIEKIVKKLAKMSYKQRLDLSGLSEKRAEIIVPGAIILLEAMTMLKVDSIAICERALREGMIVDWMLTRGLINSRLRYQNEVKNRNVLKIAHKYHVDLEYSQRVAKFALEIFDRLQGDLHDWGAPEKELLWSAAILHNCGVYISHSSHHKHSYYLIRNAELLGFTELELELIANLARYHRKSKPKKKHEPYRDLPHKQYQLMVRQLSAILRLAVALDRRNKGAIAGIKCDYDHRDRKLYFQLQPSEVGDKCSLELWNLSYKKEAFEEEFNLELIASVAENQVSAMSY